MNDPEIIAAIKNTGAYIDDGHFVYTAIPRKHGRVYINWADVLAHPEVALLAAQKMAELVLEYDFGTIVGPTHTGDKVSTDVNRTLFRMGRETFSVFAQETEDGGLSFPRDQEKYVHGHDVLIVDDVLNNVSTVRKLLPLLAESDAKPVAILVGCNRSEYTHAYENIPILSLIRIEVEQWLETACPICLAEIVPDEAVGHGSQFLRDFGRDPANWPANKVT